MSLKLEEQTNLNVTFADALQSVYLTVTIKPLVFHLEVQQQNKFHETVYLTWTNGGT